MRQPENPDARSPEHGANDDIEAKPVVTQDTMSEKQDVEKDVEDGRRGKSAHIDAAVAARIADNVDDFMTLVNEADEANERERGMTLRHALKVYPKAIGWSMLLSSCLIMEGYQTAVVGSVNLAYPAFKDRFGIVAPNGDRVIPASWQNGISGATNVGEIIGLQIAGVVSERWGYRWTIISALVAVTGFIFFPFFAGNLTVFLVGELFQGMAWGVFQTMTTAYAAEVCPVPLRHYLTAYVNLCWIIGQFISSGVLVGLVSRTDVWGYKIPFAIQWVWPIPIAIGTYLAPESPWWCIRYGKKERAEQSLKRLARSSGFSQREADAAMALMIYTDEMEKQVASGTTYLDCFKGVNLRRTEIICMTWLAQTLSGTALGGLSTFFYQQAGISDSDSFKLSWGKDAINFVGTVTSWFVLNKVGRKTLMFSGMCTIFVLLLIIGFLGIPSPTTTAEAWAAGTLVLLLSATANFSIGPVVYTIVSEVPSTRLRAKSIILARNAYNAINIAFVNVVSYRQLSPDEWNWGLKSGFFWAGINAIFTTYIFFRLPETKSRTYAELDILFENKVPARKFASTKIETLVAGTEGAQKQQAADIVGE
ncbi:general alpha-glucoside permease [Xylaria bambusicola]|uniref:general alpha-glucoside permease n=1 Tax=Xylaria bambusicola TaxID=326684 RepID=UPI002007ED62|nr:general alpha-glucoside permease [Xylaria bambusicola]KAI0513104.1 general alpha-glucoside permease [Xylaria bambusicola]